MNNYFDRIMKAEAVRAAATDIDATRKQIDRWAARPLARARLGRPAHPARADVRPRSLPRAPRLMHRPSVCVRAGPCIGSCFEVLSCFEMPHVGLEVVEDPDFDGSVAAMRKPFLFMVRNFVELMFNQKLEPKMVNGRKVRPRQGGEGIFLAILCMPRLHAPVPSAFARPHCQVTVHALSRTCRLRPQRC
jgi:hypothetical protein